MRRALPRTHDLALPTSSPARICSSTERPMHWSSRATWAWIERQRMGGIDAEGRAFPGARAGHAGAPRPVCVGRGCALTCRRRGSSTARTDRARCRACQEGNRSDGRIGGCKCRGPSNRCAPWRCRGCLRIPGPPCRPCRRCSRRRREVHRARRSHSGSTYGKGATTIATEDRCPAYALDLVPTLVEAHLLP
jgi:hypothetical protein